MNVATKEDANSAWTFGTLYLHLNEKMNAIEQRSKEARAENDRRYEQRQTDNIKALEVALESTVEAIKKSEASVEHRFQAVNEFRGALADLSKQMIPRTEVDARFNSTNEKFNDLRAQLALTAGRGAGSAALWGVMIAAVGGVGVIITIVLGLLNYARH